MSTKNERMYEKIEAHGWNLIAVFDLPATTDPVKLCKRLFRLENEAHGVAEAWCNGKITSLTIGPIEADLMRRLGKIIGVNNLPKIKFNWDCRGYFLKLNAEESKKWPGVYHDWGGYVILAPDFREEV